VPNRRVLFTRSASPVATRQNRSLVTATKPKLGGGDHHHEHRVFSGEPFPKGKSALLVFGVAGLGVAVPLWSVAFQNKKHGFSK